LTARGTQRQQNQNDATSTTTAAAAVTKQKRPLSAKDAALLTVGGPHETPIANSIFETTPWSSELAAKPSDEREIMYRTVVIDSMLLDQFVASVTLVRGTDASGRDPIKERLGVLSVFVQSVDDARFDFHRIQKQNVYGKIWLLGTQLGYYYLARLKNQALNVVHIAVLDTLMRDVVNDLLDGYFTSSKVNIDRTREIPSRKSETKFTHGVEEELLALMPAMGSPSVSGGGGGSTGADNNNDDDLVPASASAGSISSEVARKKALAGTASPAVLANLAASDEIARQQEQAAASAFAAAAEAVEKEVSQTSSCFVVAPQETESESNNNNNTQTHNSKLLLLLQQQQQQQAAAQLERRPPSAAASVIQTDKGFIVIPDLTHGFPKFEVDQKNVSVLRKLTRLVRGGGASKKESLFASDNSSAERAKICRCKMVSSALKRGQFPREAFGSAYVRLEELAHHTTWDEIAGMLPPSDIRMFGTFIAQLHARWRLLTVFTGGMAVSTHFSAQASASAVAALSVAASKSNDNNNTNNNDAPRHLTSNRGNANNNNSFSLSLEEGGFGCNRCAEIEGLRFRRIREAMTALQREVENETQEQAEIKALQQQLKILKKTSTAFATADAASSSSIHGEVDGHERDVSEISTNRSHSATSTTEIVKQQELSITEAIATKQHQLENEHQRRSAFVLHQLRIIEAPLPHPTKTSLLSWEELCHHASWAEFVSMTTDTELRRYGGLVQQAIQGLPSNISRIDKELMWVLEH
jgi:hypothetical protein